MTKRNRKTKSGMQSTKKLNTEMAEEMKDKAPTKAEKKTQSNKKGARFAGSFLFFKMDSLVEHPHHSLVLSRRMITVQRSHTIQRGHKTWGFRMTS